MKYSFLGGAIAAAFGLATAGTAGAQALPITGGITSVSVTSAGTLTGAGLSLAALGSATVSPGSAGGVPLAYFPVTGGSINTASFAGSILHDGSGLRVSSSSANISLTNFVINTGTLQLLGSVQVGGGATASNVPLFNIGTAGTTTSPFSLTFTSQAAGALSSTFGVPNLTGVTFGTANTIPITAAVPEPATVASMLAGLGIVGAVIRRRRRAVPA